MAAPGLVKYASNPVLTGVASWESAGASAGSVIWDSDENIYKMWYSGKDQDGFVRIGLATSYNTVNWTKYPGNPVMDVGTGWQSNMVGGPSVIKDGLYSYKMWYTGANVSNLGQIGYATSTNGTSWTKYGGGVSPVLAVGSSGSWDENGVLTPCVIWDSSVSMYKMWYTGRDDDSTTLGLMAIGYAVSGDGISWSKYAGGASPIMQKNIAGFDNRGVGAAHVVKNLLGNPYTMYYTGFETGSLLSEIGKATSTDGVNWTRQATAELGVSPGGIWEIEGVGDPSVLVKDNNIMMWYTGTDRDYLTQMGFASEELPVLPTVPASSNTGTLILIGSFTLLIASLVLLRGRFQHQSK